MMKFQGVSPRLSWLLCGVLWGLALGVEAGAHSGDEAAVEGFVIDESGSLGIVDDLANAPGATPVVGANLRIVNLAGQLVGGDTTGAGGGFAIANLPAGLLRIEVRENAAQADPDTTVPVTTVAGVSIPVGKPYAVSREAAIATVLPGVLSDALVVGSVQPLPTGTSLTPRFGAIEIQDEGEEPESADGTHTLSAAGYVFYHDPSPSTRFTRRVEYRIVDANSGALTRVAAGSPPVINGIPSWHQRPHLVIGLDLDTGTHEALSPEIVQAPADGGGGSSSLQAAQSALAGALARDHNTTADSVFALLVSGSEEEAMSNDLERMLQWLKVQGVPTGIQTIVDRGVIISGNVGVVRAQPGARMNAGIKWVIEALNRKMLERLLSSEHSTFIVYYTGHAGTNGGWNDEGKGEGLHNRLNYPEFGNYLQPVAACRVRIVSDACDQQTFLTSLHGYLASDGTKSTDYDLLSLIASMDQGNKSGKANYTGHPLTGYTGGRLTEGFLQNVTIANGDLQNLALDSDGDGTLDTPTAAILAIEQTAGSSQGFGFMQYWFPEASHPGILHRPAPEDSAVCGAPSSGMADVDNDGIPDILDDCPFITNPGQLDNNGDGIGDACDPDGDGLSTEDENALGTDPNNADSDGGGANDFHEEHIQGTDPLNGSDDQAPGLQAPEQVTGPGGSFSTEGAVSGNGRYVGFTIFPDFTGNELRWRDRLSGETYLVKSGGFFGEMDVADRSEWTIAYTDFTDSSVNVAEQVIFQLILEDEKGPNLRAGNARNASTGIERIDVDSNEVPSATGGSAPSISGDASRVAFASFGDDLVAGDSNGAQDIFLRDRTLGTTTRVSVASGGGEADGSSFGPDLSKDGSAVAFDSMAANLVAGDGNAARDVFLHTLNTGTTERISVASDGTEGNGNSSAASASTNGQLVAFESAATNLVANDTNGRTDIFVRDLGAGTTERVSVASDGSQASETSAGASIAGDGRFVVFSTFSDNLVSPDSNFADDVFVHDRQTGATAMVSRRLDGSESLSVSLRGRISGDGRVIVFSSGDALMSSDVNGMEDVYAFPNPLYDTDGDGIPDATDTDDDGDFLPDSFEAGYGTDPYYPDADGDGLPDGYEAGYGTDPLDPDSDDDGLTDLYEVNFGLDPHSSDSDDDGLSDLDEVVTHGTNPGSADSDGDGIPDAIEIQMGSDPMDTLDTPVFGVPSLGPVGLTLTTALLSLAGAAALGIRRRRRSGDGSGPTA